MRDVIDDMLARGRVVSHCVQPRDGGGQELVLTIQLGRDLASVWVPFVYEMMEFGAVRTSRACGPVRVVVSRGGWRT